MKESKPDPTSALADLVGVMLEHNLGAGIYDQFVRVGQGQTYTRALKNAILVLGSEGALIGIEQRLGVKLPPEVLTKLVSETQDQAPGTNE
jgi:hypothetical protein